MRPEVSSSYLRHLLRVADLTQLEAADLIGVHLRTMQRYLGASPGAISNAAVLVLEQAAERALRREVQRN